MYLDRTPQNLAIGVALAVVLYLASPPFAIWAAERTHAVYLLGDTFEAIYTPAGWLFDRCPPYHWYITTALRALEGAR